MSSFLSTIKDRRRLGYLTSGVLICVLLVFFITLPIVSVFLKSFQDKDGLFTLENYYNAFTMEETGNAIKNSLLLSLSVTGLSTLIAVPEAYILAKTKLKRLWWLDLVMMIPFMVPPYINSMETEFYTATSNSLDQWPAPFSLSSEWYGSCPCILLRF